MLLQDEQYVLRWLSQYGALTKTQVIRLLKDKTQNTAEKIIRNLKRQFMVSDQCQQVNNEDINKRYNRKYESNNRSQPNG